MKTFFFIISLSGLVILLTIDILCGAGGTLLDSISMDLLYADAVLLFMPMPHERQGKSISFVLPFVLLAVCILFSIVHMKQYLTVILIAFIAFDMIVRMRAKFSKVRDLFKSNEVWNNVLDYVNLFNAFLVIMLVSLNFTHPFAKCMVILVQVALVPIVFFQKINGKTVILRNRKEKLIKSIANANLRDPKDYDDSSENRRMGALYKMATEYMENKRPYLDDKFSLESFSRMLFTNKVYLSRTVNVLSGRNFRQFVNHYRVRYSTDLFKQDPRLKVEELAMMSGFHTVVSYNMAFRLFMDETPSEWMRRYRSTLL